MYKWDVYLGHGGFVDFFSSLPPFLLSLFCLLFHFLSPPPLFSLPRFGQVVEAKCKLKKDPHYGSKFALKFQNNETERAKRMNIEEVSFLKFCDHPNIVKMFRALEVRSEVWMVMELLRGGNLKQASTNKVCSC